MILDRLSTLTGLPTARLTRIIRFLIMGTAVNLLMIGAIIVMKTLGLGYDFALLITNIVGLCINYIVNRTFVFQSSDSVWRTALLYAATYASVYCLQLVLYRIIFATGFMHEYLAIVVTVGLSAIYAYLVLERLVFPQRKTSQPIVE